MRTFLISIIIASSVYAGGGGEGPEQKQGPPPIIIEPPKVEVIVEEGNDTLVQIIGIVVGAVVTITMGYFQYAGWTPTQRKNKAAQRREEAMKKEYSKKEAEK